MAQRYLLANRNNNDDIAEESNVSRSSILEGMEDEVMIFQLFEIQDTVSGNNSTTSLLAMQNNEGAFILLLNVQFFLLQCFIKNQNTFYIISVLNKPQIFFSIP